MEVDKDRPTLETERLILRRPDTTDIEAIVTIAGDWEIARRLARIPHPYSEEDARFFLDRVVPNEWVWAVTLRGTGELVGMVGLTPGPSEDTAELGYYVDRWHWASLFRPGGISITIRLRCQVAEIHIRRSARTRQTAAITPKILPRVRSAGTVSVNVGFPAIARMS
jgi:hypothetical protein